MHFEMDSVAIRAFHSMVSWNIVTIAVVGNSGNLLGKVTNVAPWMVLVAASNIYWWINVWVLEIG